MRRSGPSPFRTTSQGSAVLSGEFAAVLRLQDRRARRAAVVHTLTTCEWGKKGLPPCLIRDSGTGIASADSARHRGSHGRLPSPLLATEPVDELVKAAARSQTTEEKAASSRIDSEGDHPAVRRDRPGPCEAVVLEDSHGTGVEEGSR